MLALLFIAIGIANGLRAGMAVYVQPVLQDWTLSLPLPLLASVYGLFALLFTTLGIAFLYGKRLPLALPLVLIYQATVWLLHLLGDRSSYARALWGRNALLTALFLLGVAWLLWPGPHKSRIHRPRETGDANSRKSNSNMEAHDDV